MKPKISKIKIKEPDDYHATIRDLNSKGRIPRKSLGQHYMLNSEVNEQFVNAANVVDGDMVLEIGPGTGSLTNVLVESGANALAIGKDPYMAALVNERFAGSNRVKVIQDDFTRCHLRSHLSSFLGSDYTEVNSYAKVGSHLVSSSMAQDNESALKNPGLRSDPPDEETKGYCIQQTMYRIKDPKASLKFYSDVRCPWNAHLRRLLKRWDFADMKFSLYFMGYEDTSCAPKDPDEHTEWTLGRKATVVLTHNWGTEDDPKFEGYHNRNSEPRGYGHIGITVDDTYKACKRFESLDVQFVKQPDEGKTKGLAFIKDPDGYWIEIFDFKNITSAASKQD